MRDAYLFTSSPINYNECLQPILNNVKNTSTNKTDAFWGEGKCFWQFEIINDKILKGHEEEGLKQELLEWASHIPISNPYFNTIFIRRTIDAKRIIEVLIKIYPDLYVNLDDIIDWYGTAQEFIDTEFDF